MGNATSGSSPGTLSLVLDPPPASSSSTSGAYFAGQSLSGSVYAQSKSNVPAQTPLNIGAYISGKERSRVRYTETQYYTDASGNRRSRTVTRYRYAERRIVHMTVDLGAVTTGVEAGARYRFPFHIELPPDLPSSMFCSEGRGGYRGGGHCEISYKIKAELKGSGMFGTHRVQQSISVVSAPLPAQPLPNLIQPLTQKVNVCCCVNAGTITLGARVENTRIGRGEAAAIDFACKNQSLRGIDRAEAHIVEEIRWAAGGRHNYARRTIASQTFRPTARWETLSKEEMKTLRAKSKDPTSSYRDNQQKMLQMIHKAIFDGDNRALLHVPSSSLTSYRGMLIQVGHHLKIKVYTSGRCSDSPKIKLPVFVGIPPGLSGGPQQPPTAAATPSAPPTPLSPPPPSAPPAEWSDVVTATPVLAGGAGAVLGGGTIVEVEGEGPAGDDAEDEHGVVFVTAAEVVPTLPNLLKEIEYAVSPVSTVREFLDEEKWKSGVFDVLTPTGYASIIKAVAIEFDQPEMAATIAPAVRGGDFTHEYIVAALRCVSEWLRTNLVQKLIPFCKDLDRNASKILSELSDWERVCTERDFEEAAKQ